MDRLVAWLKDVWTNLQWGFMEKYPFEVKDAELPMAEEKPVRESEKPLMYPGIDMEPVPVIELEEKLTEEPEIEFASFQCDTCGSMVTLDEYIMPGQVGVVRCECGESWTIYCAPLSRFKTKDLPDDLQSVWEQMSREQPE